MRPTHVRSFIFVVLAFLLVCIGLAKDPEPLLPGFDGTVRGIGPKSLMIVRPDDNTIEFNCTRKTKFFEGQKRIDASAIQPGDYVLVEAKHAPDGTIDAVTVRLDRRKPR